MSQAFPDRNHVKTNKTPQKWIFSVRNPSDPNLWIRTQVPNRVTQTPLTQQNQGFRVLKGITWVCCLLIRLNLGLKYRFKRSNLFKICG